MILLLSLCLPLWTSTTVRNNDILAGYYCRAIIPVIYHYMAAIIWPLVCSFLLSLDAYCFAIYLLSYLSSILLCATHEHTTHQPLTLPSARQPCAVVGATREVHYAYRNMQYFSRARRHSNSCFYIPRVTLFPPTTAQE